MEYKCKVCKHLLYNGTCYRCSKHELLQPCEDYVIDKKIIQMVHKYDLDMYIKNKGRIFR